MKYLKHAGYVASLGAALAFGLAPLSYSANAMPNALAQTKTTTSSLGGLQKVDYHGHHWHHHHRHWHHGWDNDWNPGAAIALGVIGSLVASGVSESEARSDVRRCEERYRSFEPDTGLYTTYGGEKRLCPYLR